MDAPYTVKGKAQWELYKATGAKDGPARRTGHICVSYGDRIIMSVPPAHLPERLSLIFLFVIGLGEQMVYTIIMTLGRSMSILDNGRN